MEVEAADLFEQRGVRSHREKKFFRKRKVACGPDLLQKHCIYEQSFQEVGNYLMNEIPNEDIFPGDVPVKDLELDPFAAPSFYALYSLNKKKRWMVEKLMSEDVESYQTETLRVSAASLAITALDTRYYAMGQAWYYMKELAARSHHSYRKGEEIHESSRNGRLDQYLRPENPPARRRGRRLKKRPYPERDPDDVLANRSEVELKPHERRVHLFYTLSKKDRNKSCMNANHDISKKATLSRGYWQLEYEAKPQKPKPPRKAQRAFWDFHDGRDILSDDDEGSLEGLAEKTSGPTEVSLVDLVVPRKRSSRKRKSRGMRIFKDYRPVLNEEGEKVELSTDQEEEEEIFAEPTVVNVEPLPRTDQFEIDILGIQSLPTIPPVFSTTNIAGDLVIIRDGGFFLNPKGLEIMAETRKKDVVVEETIFREMDTVHSEIPKVLTQACAEKFALELITKETEAQTSSDTVAPMSQAEKECEICLEEGFQMALASCGHFSCVDCWANYAARAVQDSRVPLRCIGEKCLEVVPISVILSFLRQELVHRYEKQMANRRLLQADFLLCKRCERFLFTTTSSKALLICDCGAAWCRGCREEAHEPLSCENMRRYEDMLRRSGQSFRNVALGHVATGVRCPRCSGLIERTHGCNHMECLCGCAFCYACRGPFTGSHYNCEADAREEYALIDGEDTVHRSVFQKCFQLRQKKNPVQVLGWRRRLEKVGSKDTVKKLVDCFLQLLEFLERALVHRFFCYRRVHFNQGHLLAQQFSSLEERLHFLLGRVREEQDVSKIEALLGSALRICDNLNERCQRM